MLKARGMVWPLVALGVSESLLVEQRQWVRDRDSRWRKAGLAATTPQARVGRAVRRMPSVPSSPPRLRRAATPGVRWVRTGHSVALQRRTPPTSPPSPMVARAARHREVGAATVAWRLHSVWMPAMQPAAMPAQLRTAWVEAFAFSTNLVLPPPPVATSPAAEANGGVGGESLAGGNGGVGGKARAVALVGPASARGGQGGAAGGAAFKGGNGGDAGGTGKPASVGGGPGGLGPDSTATDDDGAPGSILFDNDLP